MRVDPATLRDLEFFQTNASATGIFDHLDFTQTHQGRKGAQCKTSLFLIASHLTEVAQDLENVPELSCAYFWCGTSGRRARVRLCAPHGSFVAASRALGN